MKEPKVKQKGKQNIGAHTYLKDTNALQAQYFLVTVCKVWIFKVSESLS